jgi:hypothetical protein
MGKRNKMGKKKATIENVKFIKDNFFRMTDEDMADALRMSVPLVRKIRKTEGLTKIGRKDVDSEEIVHTSKEVEAFEEGDKSYLGKLLDDDDNKESIEKLFNRMFSNTQHFNILKLTYSEEEVKYYLQEFNALYSEVKSQGGTLTTSEFRCVDQYIQLTLRRNRLVREERSVLEDIDQIKNGRTPVELTDVEKATVFQLTNQIKDVGRNLKEINEMMLKLQESLDMSRKERLKRISDTQSGIPKLIQDMQDERKRSKVDRHAYLMRKAKDKMEKRWREEGIIMDTNKDKEAE